MGKKFKGLGWWGKRRRSFFILSPDADENNVRSDTLATKRPRETNVADKPASKENTSKESS